MTNYTTLTNEELDRMSAELVADDKKDETVVCLAFSGVDVLVNGEWIIGWHPTNPDSNQAERYLFPKLIENGFHVNVEYRGYLPAWVNINRTNEIKGKIDENFIDVEENAHKSDQINRTKTIACLMAWDKLNE